MLGHFRISEMGHWYYGENGQQIGPIDDATMRAAISGGKVGVQTLVWKEGMANWQPVSQVTELASSPGIESPYIPPVSAPVYYGGTAYAPGVGRTSGLAISGMVCGIVGLVTCFFLLGIPAVICGHMAMSQINNSSLPMSGRGMAISGLVMGYLQIIGCLSFLGILLAGFRSV